MDSGDKDKAELGRLIRNEVGRKTLPKKRIDHTLFTFDGQRSDRRSQGRL